MDNYFENIIFNADNSFNDSITKKESLEFVACQFFGTDFSEINFSRLKFIDCEFIECNLSNSSLRGAFFRHAIFLRSKLIGLNWTEVLSVSNCSFLECIMDYSVFHSMNLKKFVFTECKMLEVEFSAAQLSKASLNYCMLKGASFNKANLSEADLRGSADYYIDVRYTEVRKAKFSMPEALSLLSSLDITLE